MKDCIIAMRSVTLAGKAERALRSAGIKTELVSVEPSLTKRGCSYGLSVECGLAERCERLLKSRGIDHGEVIGRY